MFQIFQVTKINFDQYLKLHKHPDSYIIQCTLLHKLNILPYAHSLFRELHPTDLEQNSKNKILHHIGPQMNVTQLTTNFKKTPLKLLSTTILCTNHILTFPFDGNLQSIHSVNIQDDIIHNDSNTSHMNRPDEQIAVTTSKRSSSIQLTHHRLKPPKMIQSINR